MEIGAMWTTSSSIAKPFMLPIDDQRMMQIPCTGHAYIGLTHSRSQYKPIGQKTVTCPIHSKRASPIRAITLNARCAAVQTQTRTRKSSTITVAPSQGILKPPKLDDGGAGLPPRDDGGGGGGGGDGWPWSGGWFLFGILAFLGFLKDKEEEGETYGNQRR